MISQAAIDLIVNAEVTSKDVYERRYRRPEWPGGESGVTVAIGYDLGMATAVKIRADWQGQVSAPMLEAMASCAGVSGEAAKELCSAVRSKIDVPWDAAMAVFMGRDVPEWTARVCAAIPGADKLSPDCLGALVSLAYNRGASFTKAGDRYQEMRAVRAHIMAGELAKVPGDIRAMKRLWGSDQRGLLIRRDAEADLFAKGLTASSPAVATPANQAPAQPPPAPTPAPAPQGPSATPKAAGGVAGGASAGAAAAKAGFEPWAIVACILVGFVIGALAVHFLANRKG